VLAPSEMNGMRLRQRATACSVSVGLLSTLLGAQNPRSSDAQTGTQPKLPADHSTSVSPIKFAYQPIPFELDSCETSERQAPETMAGGVAVFDYNNDGKLDIFFTNGADINTLRKSSPKYSNHLFENVAKGTSPTSPRRRILAALATTSASQLPTMTTTDTKISSSPVSTKTRSITTTETVLSRM
jgi:hypothetical protein